MKKSPVPEPPLYMCVKQTSVAVKWKANKSVQQDKRLLRVVQEKPHSQFVEVKSSSSLSRDSQQVCFCCLNIELQLQVKHQNGAATHQSRRKASNNTQNWIVETVELACATPVIGRPRDGLVFWKSAEASKWVLEVPRDGHYLIIMKAFLKNENLYAMKWLSCLHLVL